MWRDEVRESPWASTWIGLSLLQPWFVTPVITNQGPVSPSHLEKSDENTYLDVLARLLAPLTA